MRSYPPRAISRPSCSMSRSLNLKEVEPRLATRTFISFATVNRRTQGRVLLLRRLLRLASFAGHGAVVVRLVALFSGQLVQHRPKVQQDRVGLVILAGVDKVLAFPQSLVR